MVGRGHALVVADPAFWDRCTRKAVEIHRGKGAEPKFFPGKVLDLLEEWLAQEEERARGRRLADEQTVDSRAAAEKQARLAERIARARGGDQEELAKLSEEGLI
jgi:hypothetical protein